MSLVARYKRSFEGLPRPAWLLATVLLVNTSGTMVVFFLTIYLTRHLGWTPDSAGLGMSGYGVGMLAGTLTGGLMSDRLGAYRVQRLSLTGAGALLLALSFLQSAYFVVPAVVIWGFFAAALSPANAAAMAAVCPPDIRARGFVLNRLAANLGVTIGPVVGGILAQYDYRLLFWVDSVTCLLAAGASLWFFAEHGPETAPLPHGSDGPRYERWRDDRVFVALMGLTFGVALVFSQLFSTYGMYLKLSAGLAESRIGGLIAINTAMIVIIQMPLTHATDRLSRTRITALGALLLGIGFGLTPLSNHLGYLASVVALWTFGEMLTLPVLTTLVSLRAPEGGQGRYQGLFSMSYSLGVIVGPAIGTRLYTHGGGTALWGAVAATAIVVSLAMLALARVWDGRNPATPSASPQA